MTKRKALVVGGSGFIGRYVVRNLQASAGWEAVDARPLGLDLLDVASVGRVVDTIRPDAIINLAAVSTLDQSNIPLIYRLNALAIVEVLDWLRKVGFTGRFVNTSSSLVYGMNTPRPLSEDDPLDPVHHYAIAKAAADRCSLNFIGEVDVVVARVFNCIGRDHAASFVVPKIVAHFRDRRPSIELGDTTNRRDFVDVRDLARMYEAVIDAGHAPPVVNFCSGRATSIDDLIGILEVLTRHHLDVVRNPAFMRKTDSPVVCGRNDRLAALGFSCRHELSDTLRWMLDA